MTFRCDPTTRAELDASPNKLADAAVLQAALGNSRVITCKRNANGAIAEGDVWGSASSVTFRQINSTGFLKVVGGKVVGLGRIKGTTLSVAADVASGKSVMRVEGNNRWFEVSLGSADSGADVIATGYFTANNGFALRPDFAISGKKFKPSGTGPVAPALDADAPAAFRVLDYANPAVPVIVGTAQINVRDLDMVMDHPALASELGDVRVMRVADNSGVVLGTGGDCFRFAATLYSSHAGINSENPSKPVHQVLIGAKPHGRWPSYPFKKDFVRTEDTLAPPPFKIELLRADGSVLHVFEMYSTRVNDVPGSGKAINAVDQGSSWSYDHPLQPWWTCQMMLPWQSAKPKRHSKINHWMPSVDAQTLDWTNNTAFDAAPEQWPLATGNYLTNGLGAWRMASKWSRKRNGGYDTTIMDTYFNQPYRDEYITTAMGYGHEPGATGHHIWFMSPGGARQDRACWPEPLVRWASTPNANRPQGNVPLEELKDHWLMNYFNEGCHYHTDLEGGVAIPKTRILNGEVCYNGTYYSGGNENFRPDIENSAINLLTLQAAQHSEHFQKDKHGRNFCNEYQRDNQHSYSNAAVGVYMNNSAMHAIGARHSFNSHILAGFGMSAGTFSADEFITRQHAWHMWQHAQMWMVTSSDSRSISRAELEAMWEKHLTATWDAVYPKYLNDQGVYGKGLRNLGTHMQYDTYGDGSYRLLLGNDCKTFYMGIVLMFMKQTGSWDSMRAKSVKCQQILDLIVECLCRFSVDFFVETRGAVEGYAWFKRFQDNGQPYPGHEVANYDAPTPAGQPAQIPTSWADYMAKYCSDYANQTWVRGQMWGNDTQLREGYVERGEGGQANHFRAQWLWIMRDYFPEKTYPRLDQAITMVQGFYDEIEANRLAKINEGNFQWHYRFTPWGKFLPPVTNVGAPA